MEHVLTCLFETLDSTFQWYTPKLIAQGFEQSAAFQTYSKASIIAILKTRSGHKSLKKSTRFKNPQ
ncbi:hypothetical protein [Staphylococcus marylandisciuri]|uniref:hypothetical protein n=1 Tax=Staphylococcus marylandisciuri TaxID=2981529 RepID=UPI0021CFA813|nr:hypothetical protein [Staphylococcus marylandisciuri]